MLRARRYALTFVALGLLFGAGGLRWVSLHAASEYSLQFDGVDDRVTFGPAAGTGPGGLGAQTFTLELWFMRTGAGSSVSTGTGGITAVPLVTKGVAQAENSNVDMNYFLGIDAKTRVLAADFEDMNGGVNHPVYGRTAIADNIWYHAAATYDGTTWRLYLNGELEAQLAVTGTALAQMPRWDSIQHAGLGTAMNSTGTPLGFFKGQMDEVRIWNYARTQADIQDKMDEPMPAPPAGVIGRWGLDDGTGTTALNSVPGQPVGSLLPLNVPPAPAGPPVWIAGGSAYTAGVPPAGNTLRLSGTSAAGDFVSWERGPFPLTTAVLGTPKFTLETWFKREATGVAISTGTGGIASLIPLISHGRGEAEASNKDFNYLFGINTSGANPVLAVDFEEGATGATPGLNHPLSGTTALTTGTWYHGAATYDGTTLKLYLNGVLEGSIVVGQPPRSDSIQPAALGTALDSTGAAAGFFAGSLDETRIWSDARTAQQIASGMNREIPSASTLMARWSFNEGFGKVVDSTSHLPYGLLNGTGWSWATRTPTPFLSVVNAAPVVDAGPDASASFPSALLAGSVTDDGVDTGTPFVQSWSKKSGPGTVAFADATSPNTTATFSVVGTYVLTLTANDGERSASDDVTITVIAGSTNLPPTANAGADQVITFPSQASLMGSYTDDGQPGVDVDTVWSVDSGPGTVTIAQSQELNTTASFSATGTYVLRLTADDGALTGSDTVTITVNAPSANAAIDLSGNAYVTFGAAPGLGASTFTLEAWIKREGAGTATSTGTGGVSAIPIVTKGRAEADGSNQDMNYFLGIDGTSGKLVADFEEGAAGTAPGLNHPQAGNTVVTSNVWHHVAATYDGSKWRLYLDGALDGESPVAINQPPRADSIQHAGIGTAMTSTGAVSGFFNGVIDEVRIWSGARTQAQIADGMSGEVPSQPTLLGRWGLNENAGGDGTTIADGSGHGIVGLAKFTFTWVSGAPFTSPDNAPDAPVLNAPLVGAKMASPATLNVKVSDSDGDPLTVTYYGRPKQAPVSNFTYVTIPDTQHYVDNTTYPQTFTDQTNWIVANRDALNIAFVSHLGDIVEHQDQFTAEWDRATTSMTVLDSNGVKYGVSPGNHDQSTAGVADKYDLYFPPSRYLGQPWYLGYMGQEPGDQNRLNKDNYETFSAGGMDFLVIHIEMDWPTYAVAWADKIIKRYPNHHVILSSHLFLDTTNTRPTAKQFRADGTSAEAVWQQIIKSNCNVFMVVNGHYPGEGRRTDLNDCGKPVHQVLMDYQSRPNGGDGWLRYFVFKPLENKISAYTYSVTKHQFETDADSQFELDYPMSGTPFSVIGTKAVASGTDAIQPWTGLAASTDYEWYVEVNDGKKTTTGPTWIFSTPSANTAPVAQDDSYSVNEDAVLNVSAPGVLANDTDAEGDALSAVLVSGPSHGTLSLNSNGSFTYTPVANYSGSDSFTYKANDGSLDSNTVTVSITVNPVNDAPVAVDDSYSIDEDVTLTVSGLGVLANDSDEEGSSLSALLVSGPSHGILNLNGDGSFSYTPAANYNGSDTFSYRASDGTAQSNPATVTIIVASVNDGPSAVADAATTAEDTPATIAVLANDTDVDGGTLTVTGVGTPGHGGAAINADGTVTYTPALNYNGADTFSYTISDGQGGSASAAVTVTVTPVNDQPSAADDIATTAEDTPATIAVLGNDTDPDGDAVSVTSVSTPAHGSAAINADGTVSYTPALNYNGADSFTYAIGDGQGGSASATVNVTVTPVNDNPSAVDDAATTAEDTSAAIAVLANDTDLDGDALSVGSVSTPGHGSAVINPDGTISYAPAANYNGSDSFSYTIKDGQGGSATATVNMTVTAVNDNPSAADDAATTAEDTAATVAVLANDTDLDGDALSITSVGTPAHGSAVINADGTVTYTPALNYNGSDSFTYAIADGQGGSATGTVAVTVTAVNDAPAAGDDAATTAEDTAATIAVLANDSDVDGDSLSVTGVSAPAHGSAVANPNGTIGYTPALNYHGSDSFSYTIGDGHGGSATAAVTLTVTAVNDAPVAVSDSYSTDEDTALTIAAAGVLGNDMDVDGDTLHAMLVSGPSHGTLSLNANGGFTYTPAADFNGSDSFTYRANDGSADSNVATASITVNAERDPAVLTWAAPGPIVLGTPLGSAQLNATANVAGTFTYTPAAGTVLPVGSHTLSVGFAPADSVNYSSASSTVPLSVTYAVCALYDQTKAVKSGATIPVKLALCDASGTDRSSASVVVTATGLTLVSTSASGTLIDAGNSNPDNNFRFDQGLGASGGYIFNLKTTGLISGVWKMTFSVAGDPVPHTVQFEVR